MAMSVVSLLQVARVTITSMESDVFYSRLVLSLEPSTMPSVQSENVVVPASRGLRSVDMRPSDGIALALRCRAPLFISKKVAEDIVGVLKKPADPLNSPGLQAQEDHPLIVNHISNYASSQSKMTSSLIVFSEDEYKRLILRSSEKTQNGSRALWSFGSIQTFSNLICTDSGEDKLLILCIEKADHFSPRTKLGSFWCNSCNIIVGKFA